MDRRLYAQEDNIKLSYEGKVKWNAIIKEKDIYF